MDLLSHCPSLSQILSFVDSNDVIRCLQLTKRINSVVTNNWAGMKKPCIKIQFRKIDITDSIHVLVVWFKPARSDLLVMKRSRVTHFLVHAPLLLNRFPKSGMGKQIQANVPEDTADYSSILRQFLSFILPRVELKTLQLDLKLTNSETDAVFESVRDFHDGYISEIVSNRKFTIAIKLFELCQYGSMRYVDLGQLTGYFLNQEITKAVEAAEYPIRMKPEADWHPMAISYIMQRWQAGAVNTPYVQIESTNKDFRLEFTKDLMQLFAEQLHSEFLPSKNTTTDNNFYVSRTIDEKKLHVKHQGNVIELVEI